MKGADLVGRPYTPPFAYYAGHAERLPGRRRADLVTTTDGTGLVHSAGAYGEDDKVVTDREGIEPAMPVGKDGRFTYPVDEYAGHARLRRQPAHHRPPEGRDRGRRRRRPVSPGTVLLRRETYDHSYPHCWRCREPLIYKAVSSWFVEVTEVQAPDARAQRADRLGARAHQARPVRQVAGERARLVDHPQPVLGLADPGVAQRRPGVPAHRRLRLASTSSSATSGSRSPTCIGRSSTS